MLLLLSLKAQNFENKLYGYARRGIDFPTLFVRIGGVVHEILTQEGKHGVSKCYSGCFFGNFIAQGATPKKVEISLHPPSPIDLSAPDYHENRQLGCLQGHLPR